MDSLEENKTVLKRIIQGSMMFIEKEDVCGKQKKRAQVL